MTSKYIKCFPKPVLDDLLTGKWLPVVGAGMSLNAIVPTGKKMLLWNGLGEALAKEIPDFSSTGALDAISAFEHEFGRTRLVERLSDLLLMKDAQPGDAHKEFCTIPFDIVCTTNFDFLLERQYDLTPRYVYPIVDEEQLSVNSDSAGTLLVKLHADLHHPKRLVVTEADYDGFLTHYPLLATYLANLLITRTAVFIGYSLEDPDFRQIWRVVSERLGRSRRMAYTIAVGASSADVARYERRNVKIINLPGSRDRYGQILAATFRDLRDYMRENVITVSKVTEEQPLRELLLPRDTETRLCFFSLPLEMLPFYRERIFPIVEEAGFVPVTADDVVTPGDNVSAKLDALIDRASVMIVELSSGWTAAEYRMAIARINGSEGQETAQRRLRLIIVVTDKEQVPPSAVDFPVVIRPNVVRGDPADFVGTLRNYLTEIAKEVGASLEAEPMRLLKAKEYRAAVISAMALLEARLRERLSKSQWPKTRRPMSFRSLADLAAENGAITLEARNRIEPWMRTRNEVVHSSVLVSAAQARHIVNGAMELMQDWH
ncbi:MAG TPA: SIR2 family protein [Candidatus Acidoferrum sp.]